MRIVFFGTGKFGIASLEALLESKHEVVAVVTQPDRKKGRGWNMQPTPIKAYLQDKSVSVDIIQPESAKDPSFIEALTNKNIDLFVVIDYGQFLSKALLEVPSKYSVNLHPSLLPKYRGAAPVNWVLLEGETETGNTVIKMNERMDAGDIVLQEKLAISPEEDSLALSVRLSSSGASLLLEALGKIERGEEKLVPQDEANATLARKLKKEMGQIDWNTTAQKIEQKVKAFNPWPGAFTYIDGKLLKILDVSVGGSESLDKTPGTVISTSPLEIATSSGSIIVNNLQLEGKKAISAKEFIRGYKIAEGMTIS